MSNSDKGLITLKNTIFYRKSGRTVMLKIKMYRGNRLIAVSKAAMTAKTVLFNDMKWELFSKKKKYTMLSLSQSFSISAKEQMLAMELSHKRKHQK